MTDQSYNTQLSEFLPTASGVEPTMSSREIADVCSKKHANVLRDIRAYVGAVLQMERGIDVKSMDWDGKEGLQLFEDTPIGGVSCRLEVNEQNGQSYPVYYLDKSASLTVVSGYNVLLRKRIIDRWMDLEQAKPAPTAIDFSDPRVILGAFQHLQLTCNEQAQQIAAMAPTVEAFEQIAEAHGSMCRTEAAKHLGVPPHTLCKWLRTNMWTYRRAGTKDDLAYQAKINAGYLEHKVTTGPRPDGTEWIGTQVRVTPRGLTVLAKAFPKAMQPAVLSVLRNYMAKVA